ncbi:hypothetical protein EPO44_18735 [bacterium]|nr:MAG: hypothetical protein EPO44_18735 [bacterium]
MNNGGKYFAMAAEQGPAAGKGMQEVPTEPPWWSGVVLDSVLGFSAMLVFVLAGVLYLRKRIGRRGHSK